MNQIVLFVRQVENSQNKHGQHELQPERVAHESPRPAALLVITVCAVLGSGLWCRCAAEPLMAEE